MLHLNQGFERERELKALPHNPLTNKNKGFTLVELLIVISILAALAAAVVVVINPAEMLRQARDSTRMGNIGTLHRTLSMFQIDRPADSMGLPNRIHVSIPSDSPTCVGLGLPALPPGWTYACRPTTSHRNIDGTGWIPINFTAMFQGSPLSHLPIDPTNTAASSNFYIYVTDGRSWVLASLIESERHAPSAARDGGTDFARFEAGNNLALWTTASGLVGYWSFDEGTGITANDLSRRGNTGTLINNPTWTTGRVGGALSFDGVDDRVDVSDATSLRDLEIFTLMGWWYSDPSLNATWPMWIQKGEWAGRGWTVYAGDGQAASQPHLWMLFGSDTGGIRATSIIPITTRDWTHVTFIINRVENWSEAYNNGVLIGRFSPLPAYHSTTRSLRFGERNLGGLIDEVRIYNRALSAVEVMANFNATR